MVLPVRDVNPTRRRPFVNWILLAANIGVFVLVQLPLSACEEVAFVLQWAAIPPELLSLQPLSDEVVARVSGRCQVSLADKNVLLSAVTATFLHANLAHLAVNMLFLWVFGNNVEDRLGHVRFLLFYLAGGAASTLAFAVLNADALVPLIGASGAIAAILGAYLILFPRARVHAYVPFPLYLLALVLPGIRISSFWLIFAIVAMPAWVLLGGWFALQLVASGQTMATGVAYEAHAAGFVAGVLLLLLLDRRRARHGQPTFHPVRDRSR